MLWSSSWKKRKVNVKINRKQLTATDLRFVRDMNEKLKKIKYRDDTYFMSRKCQHTNVCELILTYSFQRLSTSLLLFCSSHKIIFKTSSEYQIPTFIPNIIQIGAFAKQIQLQYYFSSLLFSPKIFYLIFAK